MSNGKASSSKSAFRMECAVGIHIQASPEKVWKLLAEAEQFTQWNSTVAGLEGRIALNEKIKLRSTLDAKRTFKLKVSVFVPPSKMVWEDGFAPLFKGVRTYTLKKRADGSTDFSMQEVFSGLMLPMIAGSLPDFKPNFEQFAADLKKAAEKN